MITEQHLLRLNQLGDRYEELVRAIKVEQYNAPLNRDEERQKLFAAHNMGMTYNPQFHYKKPPPGWKEPLEKLQCSLDPCLSYWDRQLYRTVQQTLNVLASLETHDAGAITAASIAEDGLPTRSLVESARKIISEPENVTEERNVPAAVAVAEMQQMLAAMGVDGWEVLLYAAMNARIDVQSAQKQVRLREGEHYSHQEISRLLVHEIGTHVFRYVNGERQPLRMMRLGLHGYMNTEEGLATWHEAQLGVQDAQVTRRYALRAIAASMSLSHSYSDVFLALTRHTDVDEAFNIVTRAKRGFTDTSEFGAHVKDHVYLRGYLEIERFLQAHPQEHPYLMSGKIAIDTLSAVHELEEAGFYSPPALLPAQLGAVAAHA